MVVVYQLLGTTTTTRKIQVWIFNTKTTINGHGGGVVVIVVVVVFVVFVVVVFVEMWYVQCKKNS